MTWLKNRTTLGITCIVISLILCFAIAPWLQRGASEQTTIIRVTKEIRKGEPISSSKLTSVDVGAWNLPSDVMTSMDQVTGQYAATDLKVDDYLLPAKLSATPPDGYFAQLNGQKQALSVTIKSLAAGLSGKLQAGDIISLIAADYGDLRTTTLPPELKYIEVLSVTTSQGLDANAYTEQDDQERELPSTLTLLVLPEQAVLLSDIENKGKLHAALVYRGEPDTAQQFIQQQEVYFLQQEDVADE